MFAEIVILIENAKDNAVAPQQNEMNSFCTLSE